MLFQFCFYVVLYYKGQLFSLLQYPIIAHDCFVPIVDPLSNCQYGQLKVLLAIGSVEQVKNFLCVCILPNPSTLGKI